MNLPPGHAHAPRGPRARENSQAIAAGQAVKRDGDRLFMVDTDGAASEMPAASEAFAPEVAAGPGWIEYASWQNTGPLITSYSATWEVPPAPSLFAGQAVFLFITQQPSGNDETETLLAVVQYGVSAAGGGDFWGMSCWYVYKDRVLFSPLVQLMPGEVVTAHIERTVHNAFGSKWVASAQVEGTAKKTFLPVVGDLQLPWNAVALEAYSFKFTCQQLPATLATPFSNIALADADGAVEPDWQPTVDYPDCGGQVKVLSPQEVTLFYRAPTSTPEPSPRTTRS